MIKDGGIESPNSTTSLKRLLISIQMMAYLGTLFGLIEDAMSIILVPEMVCLSERQNGTTTITCLEGGRWGWLREGEKGREDHPSGSSVQERRRPGIHSTGQS